MSGLQDWEAVLRNIEREIASIRSKLAVRPHDEMDACIASVEALARSMVEIARGSETIAQEAQIQGAAMISASLAGRVITRLALLPAAAGALLASVVLAIGIIWASNWFDQRSSLIEARYIASVKTIETTYDDLAKHNSELQDAYEARTTRLMRVIEADYSKSLAADAASAPADIRGFLQAESAEPGFVAWVKKYGIKARHLMEANDNNFCPTEYYHNGEARDCIFRLPPR